LPASPDNQLRNALAIDVLAIKPSESLPSLALEAALAGGASKILGVDHSREMLRQAGWSAKGARGVPYQPRASWWRPLQWAKQKQHPAKSRAP